MRTSASTLLPVISAMFVLLALSGCAHSKRSSLAYVKDSGGSLSVWDTSMSAAVAYPGGTKMCMQRAMAVNNIDASATAKVSEAIMALSEAYTAAAEAGNAGDLASISGTLKVTAMSLSTTTERTAYIDMGMFYLCQIAANGSITPTEANSLLRTLIISGALVGDANASATLDKLAR